MANTEQLDELIRHNQRLVRTATDLRDLLRQATAAIAWTVEAAQPITASHEEKAVEYVIPAEVLVDLKAAHVLAAQWDS